MENENRFYGCITNVKISMGITYMLKFQMFKWMLQQRDLWIALEHGGGQMDAFKEGLVAACEHTSSSDGCFYRGTCSCM